VDEATFIKTMSAVVGEKGCTPDSSMNMVAQCRDEICRPFTQALDASWGTDHFAIGSLAGMVFCGKTAFGAGMAHSPIVGGKERYVFWVGPHVAYGTGGEIGEIYRPGREKISGACGALCALKGQIDSGAPMDISHNPEDSEMSLVRQAVLSKLPYGSQPNLIGLTYTAHDCIKEQTEFTAAAAANPSTSEYIIISGIQVNGALNENYWWPGSITHYANGKATDLSADYEKALAGYSLETWLGAQATYIAQRSAGMTLPKY
jgi:hypothetical protein